METKASGTDNTYRKFDNIFLRKMYWSCLFNSALSRCCLEIAERRIVKQSRKKIKQRHIKRRLPALCNVRPNTRLRTESATSKKQIDIRPHQFAVNRFHNLKNVVMIAPHNRNQQKT